MRLTIKTRLLLLLCAMLGVYVATLYLLQLIEERQVQALAENEYRERDTLLDRWLEMVSQTQARFVTDYSQWDEMLQFVREPSPRWAKINIDESLGNFDLEAAWVLTKEGKLIYGYNALQDPELAREPEDLAQWMTLVRTERTPHFFMSYRGELFEVRGAPILPSVDTKKVGPAQGWFFVARQWDAGFIAKLVRFIECRVQLVGLAQEPEPPSRPTLHRVKRPLMDVKGHPLRLLLVDFEVGEIDQMTEFNTIGGRIFIGFGLLLFLLLILGLHRWVLNPLRRIGEALATRRDEPLRDIGATQSEMGEIARMVQASFVTHAALEKEVDERRRTEAALHESEMRLRQNIAARARLGRDLHDGVIQTLYAAGMGLSALRSTLQTHPREAEQRLEETQAALNDAIRDLRNFIGGMEPEALNQQTFTQAVERLCELMRSLRPFRAEVKIDDALAETLTIAQRAHALQIMREAVSNALRHGKADRIQISLRRQGTLVMVMISDDGGGFDVEATQRDSNGLGLDNLAERAREIGATLTVSSQPGKGTEVCFVIPLPAAN